MNRTSNWWWFKDSPTWQIGSAAAWFEADGTVHLTAPDTALRVECPGLARDAYVYEYRDDDWGLVVGPRSEQFVLLDGGCPRLEVIDGLQRLPLLVCDDRYDPGGFDRIEFRRLGPDEVLLESEVALARIHRRHGFVWQTLHDNITCRITSIDDIAWFHGDGDAFGIRLDDGQTVFSKTAQPPEAAPRPTSD